MFLILLFVLGAIFWSFGSVLLRRLRDGWSWMQLKSILIGRSACPHCQRNLSWWQLIPLLGRMIQRGRCRLCGQTISLLYPVCEILSGLIFVWRGMWMTSYDTVSILMLAIWRLLGLILIRDLSTYQLHMPLWMIVSVLVFILAGLSDWSLLRGGVIGWGVFGWLYLFARVYVRLRFAHLPQNMQEGIGMGDVLLAPLIAILVAYHLSMPHDSFFFSAFLADISVLAIIQLVIIYILGTCVIGLLGYALSRLFSSHQTHHPDWSEGMGPVIPFLPSMIIMYRCILFLLW